MRAVKNNLPTPSGEVEKSESNRRVGRVRSLAFLSMLYAVFMLSKRVHIELLFCLD